MDSAPPSHSRSCVLCGAPLVVLGGGRVLQRYDVRYHRCTECGLVTLPEPTWLDEAYADPIYAGDEGLLRRCRISASFTAAVIRGEHMSSGRFLDWAGGYGTLARMMRDKGFDYYTTDPYTQNVLAPGYEGDPRGRYTLITAFEVLEHLPDPVAQLADISQQTDRLLVSTELQPTPAPPPGDWWYYQQDSGQHVTFYTPEALEQLAIKLGYEVASNGRQFHLFHRGPLSAATRVLLSPTVVRAGRGLVAAARDARRWVASGPIGQSRATHSGEPPGDG